MKRVGWLCALVWAAWPLHAWAQSDEADASAGQGLNPQATAPVRWPDDLHVPPNRPDPLGLRASPDALVSPVSGLASWYADHFHGRRTASGELYSRYDMTAAHRDVPLGTLLHVSNPQTGVGVVVRVNDRGPFHDDRVLDVSRAAARALGLVGAGVGQVDIRSPSAEEAAAFARQLADAAKRPAQAVPPAQAMPRAQAVPPAQATPRPRAVDASQPGTPRATPHAARVVRPVVKPLPAGTVQPTGPRAHPRPK